MGAIKFGPRRWRHQRSHVEIAPDVNDTTAVRPAASRTSNRSREIPAYIVWFISRTFPLQYEATSGRV